MEKPLIDIREDGLATIFWHGKRYKRIEGGETRFGWRKETGDGFKSIGESWKELLQWVYRHPEIAIRVCRFPRLPVSFKLGQLVHHLQFGCGTISSFHG